MNIELDPRLEQRLVDLASKTGKPEAAIVAEILEEALFPTPPEPMTPATGAAAVSFHQSTTDLGALIRAQGVKPTARLEDLLGDVWPEEERVDDFLAARQEWSHEGRGVTP